VKTSRLCAELRPMPILKVSLIIYLIFAFYLQGIPLSSFASTTLSTSKCLTKYDEIIQAKKVLINQKSFELLKAIEPPDQSRGLSGKKNHEFSFSQAMVFINQQQSPKTFWMPNTYFNLDILFLDRNLKLVGSALNAPFHPGYQEPPSIFRTQTYEAQYILEVKAQLNNEDIGKRFNLCFLK